MIILQPNTSTQTISIMPRMVLVGSGSVCFKDKKRWRCDCLKE